MLVQLVASSGVKIDMISIICGTFFLLGAFHKITKSGCCLRRVPSARLTAWNNLISIGRILKKFIIWVFHENLVKIFGFEWNWQQQLLLYTKTYVILSQYLAQLFLEWETFSYTFVEDVKTHILWPINIFFRNSCYLCDNVENIVQPDRPQMTIWRMHIVSMINKATNMYSEYVVIIIIIIIIIFTSFI